MKQSRLILPPLDHLLAFEAAARAGGFVGAARILNISETAISRKIRLLESHYKMPLFIRGHRSVLLTDQGARLFASVGRAMDILREASRDTLAQNTSAGLTLAATNSVASLWLTHKIHELRKTCPDIPISLIASDKDVECLSEKVDLAILRGEGHWLGFHAHKLFDEAIFPVCSPEYLQRHKQDISLEKLHALDILEVTSAHPEWMNWSEWINHQEINHQDQEINHQDKAKPLAEVSPDWALQFNSFALSIQAAVDGLGIALGWAHLVDPHLESGALVRPFGNRVVRTDSGYYLLWRRDRKLFPEMQQLIDFFCQDDRTDQQN